MKGKNPFAKKTKKTAPKAGPNFAKKGNPFATAGAKPFGMRGGGKPKSGRSC